MCLYRSIGIKHKVNISEHWNGIPRTRVRVPVEMHVFHISTIVLVPWASCLGGYSCSLVVRASERYSKDPGSSPGGDACFSH